MKWLVNLSINRPRLIIAIIIATTIFFGYILVAMFSIDVDPTKSFSRKMDVIKYYNLTEKKFSMKDTILIGVENDKSGIFNTKTLRFVERIMNDMQNLTIKKTYKDIISGKEETIEVPSEIASDDIMSIINADDVTVDKKTNTIIVGNLTRKARVKAGLTDPDPIEMERMPGENEELIKLIPYLQAELRNNDLFKGTLISVDEKACAIMVPIEKRLDNKIEIIRAELPYMINEDNLKRRFMGQDYNFRWNIYKKTVNGILVDDTFIKETVSRNKKRIRDFFTDTLSDLEESRKEFYAGLEKNEVNEEYISTVLKMIETDAIYEMEDVNLVYDDVINDIYTFVISNVDTFSRNNLESKLYNVKNIYDVGYLYRLMKDIAGKDKPEEIKVYIAGRPIAEALLEEFVINDMSVFMSFTVLVIIIILFVAFRTISGVILPVISVIISAIWLMGFMLLIGIEFSSGTIVVPSILIAVGSAYVIHYLSRYYEEVHEHGNKDVKSALVNTAGHIQQAINLAAITTIAAFLSVISSDVIDIKMLGILIAFGIGITLLMTYTLVPSILSITPLPKPKTTTRAEEVASRFSLKIGELTYNHSGKVFFVALILSVIFAIGFRFLKTESSITYMFMENNPIRVASKFIDKKLTGTGQMSIVFKMRDRVNLTAGSTQHELRERIDSFINSYTNFIARHPDLKGATLANNYFLEDLKELRGNLVENQESIEKRVAVFTDILNEYYEVEVGDNNTASKEIESSEAINDLSDLSDDTALSKETNGKEVSPVEAGIVDILNRIGCSSDTERGQVRKFIVAMRQHKGSETGKEFQGKFNHMADFFKTDIRQPITLRKVETLGTVLKSLEEPKAVIDGEKVKPVGNILSITDTLKVIYKVFYHDNNEDFNKLPDVAADGIADKSLTDMSIIGVCFSQFQASREEIYRYLVTDDLKLMQFVVFARSDKAEFLKSFNKIFYKIAEKLFPPDDPYVERIVVSGLPSINMFMNEQLYYQQIQSIGITIFVVFLVCLFIFRSLTGGVLSIIPITLTVIINLGIMGWLDFPISYSTVIIASIAIGAGIDYTIHFMERFKYEHIIKGEDFKTAYFNTLHTTGRAIIISAVSVAGGFAVLALSTFKTIKVSGVMVALAMILSATASLTVLPALMNWLKPEFLNRRDKFQDNSESKLKDAEAI